MPRRSTTKWQQLYSSQRWRKASEAFRASPKGALCGPCKQAGKIVASAAVDHIVAHNGDIRLFWDRSNWQGVCWTATVPARS
jgi:5-methylcytosine-specific restriction protein A